jgi:hypothetical protein
MLVPIVIGRLEAIHLLFNVAPDVFVGDDIGGILLDPSPVRIT